MRFWSLDHPSERGFLCVMSIERKIEEARAALIFTFFASVPVVDHGLFVMNLSACPTDPDGPSEDRTYEQAASMKHSLPFSNKIFKCHPQLVKVCLQRPAAFVRGTQCPIQMEPNPTKSKLIEPSTSSSHFVSSASSGDD